MPTITINSSETATPLLARLVSGLTDRTELNGYIAGREEVLFRDYVGVQARKRHTTANRLGAKPTGHLERAATSIEGVGEREGAVIRFPRAFGLHRAFSDFTQVPKNGSKYITIPVHPLAYGKRAREFGDLVALRLGVRNTLVLARRVRGQEILETLYVLKKSVTIKQDRTLLPSDTEILDTAEKGAREFILDNATV